MSPTAELFLMAGVWLVIAALIARAVPFTSKYGKPLLFAVLIAVPFWELPYGYWNFRQLCANEVNLKVLRDIEPQDSICVGYLDASLYFHLNTLGFARIEVLDGTDDPTRYAAIGKVFKLPQSDVKSAYCVKHNSNNSLPWDISRSDTLVVGAHEKTIFARQSILRWTGTWWQRATAPILGSGGTCYAEPKRPFDAIRKGARI